MTDSPKGWASVPLDDLTDATAPICYGVLKPGERDALGIPMVRVTDIRGDRLNTSDLMTITAELDQEFARSRVRPSDVMISVQGTVGRVAVVPGGLGPTNISRTIARVRPADLGMAPWICAALRSPDVQRAMEEMTGGTTRDSLNIGTLRTVPIPVAPMEEQRRIVAKLDALTARTGRARIDLDRVPGLAARYKQAVLAAACRGDLTRGWRAENGVDDFGVASLSQLCASITDGDHQAPPKAASGVPFITISAMNNGRLDLAKATRFVPKAYLDGLKPARIARVGDVLYSVTGSFGIPAVVETDLPFVFQRHIAILKPDLDRTTGKFLSLALAGSDVLEQARAVATGTAQLTVPLTGLRSFMVPAPSLAEQAEIIRRVDIALAEIDRLSGEAATARHQLDRLDQAILAKAFRGELVAQDPADEPASALLDRIRAERAASPAKVRRGRPVAA